MSRTVREKVETEIKVSFTVREYYFLRDLLRYKVESAEWQKKHLGDGDVEGYSDGGMSILMREILRKLEEGEAESWK